MSNQLNIRHALIIGLSLNRNCREVIDEIYYKNEKLYHDTYLNSGFRDDCLKKIFSMTTEDTFNKLAGIVEVCYKKKDWLLVEKVIKKAHPSIVNFVKKSNVVDLDKFSENYEFKNFLEDEQFSIIVSLVFLAPLYKKDFVGDSNLYFILNKWNRFLSIMKADELLAVAQSEKEIVNEYINKGYDLFAFDKSDKIDCNLEYFISEDIEKKVFNKLGIDYNLDSKTLKSLNIDLSEYEETRNNEFLHGINKYVGCFSRYLHSLGLDSGDIFVDTPITNEGLENIFKDFYFSTVGNNVDDKDMELYIASCLFIYNLTYLYKDCKDIYLNQASEDKYKELKDMENDLIKQKEKFDEKEFKIKKQLKENKSEIDELKRRIKELEKANSKLESDNRKKDETINSLTLENGYLKENITELSNELDTIEDNVVNTCDISLEDKIDYINKYKIGIFGGFSNINKLSNTLINVEYYNEINQDISSINNLDMIFINRSFMNHAFTYKVKSFVLKNNLKLSYLSGTNETNLINLIYQNLINKQENLD